MLSVLPLQQECFSTAPGSKHARCPQPEVSGQCPGAAQASAGSSCRDAPNAATHTGIPTAPAAALCVQVPCGATGMPLLSLAGCVLHLPVASQGPTGVVHFVRNPWDVVVSAYFFHTQTPAPEAWLDKEVRDGS